MSVRECGVGSDARHGYLELVCEEPSGLFADFDLLLDVVHDAVSVCVHVRGGRHEEGLCARLE
jgi:hypothetical protein